MPINEDEFGSDKEDVTKLLNHISRLLVAQEDGSNKGIDTYADAIAGRIDIKALIEVSMVRAHATIKAAKADAGMTNIPTLLSAMWLEGFFVSSTVLAGDE